MLEGKRFVLVGSLAIASVMAVGPSAGASVQAGTSSSSTLSLAPCPPAKPGYSTCLARVLTRDGARAGGEAPRSSALAGSQASSPTGLSPSAITTAYGFAGTNGGSGETIALVDAYDDPTIASNLSTFSTEYGLPACTTTAGCFTKVNQTGGTTYPAATSGWDLEISLDVEWAHALAPSAHILLVEASSASDANLFKAVTYAAQHAQYVSMSWGGTEFSGETSYDADFAATPSVSFFAAAGDTASSVIYPSSSPDVISVGGTTLTVTKTTDAWKSESAWSTAGGGCSLVEKPTAAQSAFPTYDQAGATCDGRRATPDVALDANPSTGVSVYDSKKLGTGLVDWITVGGTSASTVMWAAHSTSTGAHVNATYVYGANIPFYNITTGSNGHSCEKGYSLCAGLGTWNTGHGTVNGAPDGTLSFASAVQTLTAGKPSTAMTVHLSSPAPSGGVSVKLTSSSAGGAFSTSETGSFTRTLTVAVGAGSTGTTFYYEDTVAGSPVLSAAASGWKAATQSETVQPGPLASIAISPSAANLEVGTTQTFTATGHDAYGNAVTAGFDPTWATNTGGSLSASSGTSTTLTAPATAVSQGILTADQGSVSGSATVTVVATPALKVTVTAGSTTERGANLQVPLTVTATGSSGGVSGATVVLDVYSATCSGTLVASGSGRTQSSGKAAFTFTTRTSGFYCARATVTAAGYTQGTGTAEFVVAAVKAGSQGSPGHLDRVDQVRV